MTEKIKKYKNIKNPETWKNTRSSSSSSKPINITVYACKYRQENGSSNNNHIDLQWCVI